MRTVRLKFLLLGLFIAFGAFFGLHAHAIEEYNFILINVVPENPSPGEDVSVTLQSFAENLEIPTITWFVNGKNVLSGVAKKTILLKAPPAGSEMVVLAKIVFPEFETKASVTIKPTEMVLLWQASDSYVPPFYKGRALPAPDSFVKVVAIPEIISGNVLVNPKNMVYSWKKDFENLQDVNGYGKNFLLFRNDYLENSNNVEVTATTVDQKYSSAGTINIRMYSPEISFYRKDSTLGTIWERALGNPHFVQGSDTILAVPYFISPKDIRRPDLIFSWFINDVPINVASYQKSLLPIAVEEGTSGTSEVRLEIESTDKIFQTASKTINIEF